MDESIQDEHRQDDIIRQVLEVFGEFVNSVVYENWNQSKAGNSSNAGGFTIMVLTERATRFVVNIDSVHVPKTSNTFLEYSAQFMCLCVHFPEHAVAPILEHW